jgi:hypothetical protein
MGQRGGIVMVLWLRGLAALSAVVVLASAAAGGCSGLSTDEATTRCNEDQADSEFCFDPSVFQACLACYESCGDACQPNATQCPLLYECPGQSSGTGGGGGAGGASSGTQ